MLQALAQAVLHHDERLRANGLYDLIRFPDPGAAIVEHAVQRALPWGAQSTERMWPEGKPFPLTPTECQAAAMGYRVPWRGDFDDLLLLRGRWESSSDGYCWLSE